MGCLFEPRPRPRGKQILFHVTNSNIRQSNNTYGNMKTPIQLDFTLENTNANNKYQIQVSSLDSRELFSTESEIASNKNYIAFNKCYIVDYYFERHQYINIAVYKNGDNNGFIKTPLGLIVGSPMSTYKTELGNNNEIIVIKAQSLKDSNSFIEFIFSAQNLDSDISDIHNRIYYSILDKSGRPKYMSESVSQYGHFDPIRIPLALLEPSFSIYFYDNNDQYITNRQETPDSFFDNNKPNSSYLGFSVNKKRINIINNSKIFRDFNFLDYLRNGVTIKLTIGIDFTSSNLPPNDPNSLHYLYGGMNDYESAIRACGSIVAYYDYNQSFPVYGFGAIIKGHHKANMCFNVNFQKNPEIQTIDNVINEYRNCFENIMLAGPTEFCPLIQKVNDIIRKENNPLKYHILMILTDGIIVDQQQTIDALVEGSFLPLSVIIIGIGDDPCPEMIQLDGDQIPITSSKGVIRKRDLVQFVPFNKYRNDPNELAAQVLEEVPRQIMEYYTQNNIYPYDLAKTQIKKSGFGNQNFYANNNLNNNGNADINNNYIDYKKRYNNDSYRNYLGNSKFDDKSMKNSKFSGSRNMNNSNYHVVFEDERESKGTGFGSIYY